MPSEILRFCRQCLATQQAVTRQVCAACGGELLPMLDGNGAMSRDFLAARGTCCDNGCRNCPYESAKKKCPRCDAAFECGNTGCWCKNLRVSADALKELERSYDGCLCPACLASFATGVS